MGEHTENGTQSQQTQQVEQRQPPPEGRQTALVRFDPETATEAWQLARYYGESRLISPALRQTGDIFVTIMAGRDFGWSPMQAMRGIHVVEGRPSLSADAMVAIVKSSGRCKFFRLVKSDDKEAIYETHREGDPEPVRMGFTVEEAKAAGLLERKGPWQTYRKRMLRNRAKSVLCKEVYEDIFFGVYEDDEGHEVEEIRHPEGPQKPPPLIPKDHNEPPPQVASKATIETKAEKLSLDAACHEASLIVNRTLSDAAAVKKAKDDLGALVAKVVASLTPAEQDNFRSTYQSASQLLADAEKKLAAVKP
jgi:hypothetical protein